ncbi:hypothetical protein IAU60_004061 [Kwoniella sp. DSM 27419]
MIHARTLADLALLLLFTSLLGPTTTHAFWPFKDKKYNQEAFINAGSLGFEGVTGRVVAVGDWNGDQKLDLFTLSEDSKAVTVNLWNNSKFRFTPSHTITLASKISNVVPGDFDHDGRLDLLVMYVQEVNGGWWGSKTEKLGMEVFLGGGEDGGFKSPSWLLDASMPSQPIIFDADGSLRPSMLGLTPSEAVVEGDMRTWLNNGTGMTVTAAPLTSVHQACVLADPHSSAFVDLDGDCLPDLVLHCAEPKSKRHSIQIWRNGGTSGYELSRSYDLPRGSGPLSFADMNRDGSIDIIFPTCSSHSRNSGIGRDCQINIAYNKQAPVCSTEGSQRTRDGALQCRGWGDLCIADDDYGFTFDNSDGGFTSIPLTDILPSSGDVEPGILVHVPHHKHIPLPLRPGDFNVDGFPDLLLVVHNSTAVPANGMFGGDRQAGNQVKVLVNTPCGKGVAGCDVGKGHKGRRGFVLGHGKGWDALGDIWDVEGASWLDIDDDGSLDILVQRSGAQTGDQVTFVQNNFYHDAFFLKAQVLNGACDGDCQPVDDSKTYSSTGVSYSGATYKFTVLDTLGRRVAQQVAQLPQTGYHALHTPYAFFGLGRTNNYVEKLFVGTSLSPPDHATFLESLIPNSQIIINPPYPVDSTSSADQDSSAAGISAPGPASPVKNRSTDWRTQLYLKPGEWVPWVGAAVLGTVLVLGTVVLGLNEREKKEDEKERRRALHAINFQAL